MKKIIVFDKNYRKKNGAMKRMPNNNNLGAEESNMHQGYKELIDKLKMTPAQGYTIPEAEELAKKVLQIGNYDNIAGAVPINLIARGFGIPTFAVSFLRSEDAGNIFVNGTTPDIYGNNQVIVVGEREEKFHQRFMVAHELGHYLMEYVGNHEYSNSNKLFSRAYPKNHGSSELNLAEIRADRFAAELLMPAARFKEQYNKACDFSTETEYILAYLSLYFEVKQSSVEKRIQEVICK